MLIQTGLLKAIKYSTFEMFILNGIVVGYESEMNISSVIYYNRNMQCRSTFPAALSNNNCFFQVIAGSSRFIAAIYDSTVCNYNWDIVPDAVSGRNCPGWWGNRFCIEKRLYFHVVDCTAGFAVSGILLPCLATDRFYLPESGSSSQMRSGSGETESLHLDKTHFHRQVIHT